jgi:eukaryotic-like serine/threonine-protein kinase
MIGQTISHYKILDKLGEGGMGVVYRAHDTRLDRFVALKFLPPHLSASEQEKTRFIQEAKAASALNHPNICTVYEIDETETGQLYMVMAYYEGDTLESKIRDTRNISDIKTLIDWGSQIAEGLHAAHRKGIVHRDIKSSNIMITQEGRAVIMDFGLAKHAAGLKLTRTGTTVGTVPYMSPEQARGDSVDHRSDIWSLGVVLYEMIAGRLPFASEYSQAVIYSILNEEPCIACVRPQ